jgi:hypothetical protein
MGTLTLPEGSGAVVPTCADSAVRRRVLNRRRRSLDTAIVGESDDYAADLASGIRSVVDGLRRELRGEPVDVAEQRLIRAFGKRDIFLSKSSLRWLAQQVSDPWWARSIRCGPGGSIGNGLVSRTSSQRLRRMKRMRCLTASTEY